MAMQRPSRTLSAPSLEGALLPGAGPCSACQVSPHRDSVCRDAFAALVLSVIRFIGAAYSTGNADCWEAAYHCAENSAGVSDGPLFVARAAGVVRALRQHGSQEMCYLPSSCKGLCASEAKLMALIDAARCENSVMLWKAASDLTREGQEPDVIGPANALVSLFTVSEGADRRI